ncbi:MAG: O-antigen ligase family protein [Siculibacillus sp.]
MRQSFGFDSESALLPAVVVACAAALLLGGSAGPRHFGDVVIQIAAVPMIALVVHATLAEPGRARGPSRVAAGIALSAIAIGLLQLIPLPPALWTLLPGHRTVASALALLDPDPPWLPVATSPTAVWRSLAFVAPAIALFFAAGRLDERGRRLVLLLICATPLVDVAFAVGQLASGPDGAWDPYGSNQPGVASGLFANRNHFGALIHATIPFVVALAAWGGRRHRSYAPVIWIGAAALLMLMLLGALTSRSRAGSFLAFLSFALSMRFLIFGGSPSRARGGGTLRWLVTGAIVLGIVALDFGFWRVADRIALSPLEDYRSTILQVAVRAFFEHLPFGSGLGTYVAVHQALERPQEMLQVFVNAAHNDFVQIAVETGLPGVAALLAHAIWFTRVQIGVQSSIGSDFDTISAQAAGLSAFMLMCHSVVEYPLRTGTLLFVFAFANGLTAAAKVSSAGGAEEGDGGRARSGPVGSRRRR